MFRRSACAVAVLTATTLLPPLLAPPAAAEPATTVTYPVGATATRFTGQAFDVCTAPSVAALKAWRASPYRAVGVYVGGVNRTCAQPELTSRWVTEVSKLGWRLLPIYKGRQPWCGAKPTDQKITAAGARSEGTAAAVDAVGKAKALGILPGSGVYLDIENYPATDAACRNGVLTFVSAYTKELHRRGYLSGVYANLSSGAIHLSAAYGSTSYARADALWIARWDGNRALTGWAGIPNSQWSVHQRAKQYRGDHPETHGGVTITIDSNQVDAPLATVAYGYAVTSSTALNARTGPATSYPVVRSYRPGTAVQVVCQTPGSKVGSTTVWDQLADGTYVTDYYVGTPSNTSYSAPLPRCTYPFQTTAGSLTTRTGPGVGHPTAGTMPSGSLAWIVCQQAGSRIGTTMVWNRLDDGRWVTDYYVATPSNTSYSKPIPHC